MQRDNPDSYNALGDVFYSLLYLKDICGVISLRSLTDVKPRVGGKKTEHIQQPYDYGNNDYRVQDGFNGGRHGDILID